MGKEKIEEKVDFDPDLSPNHPKNIEAAKIRGLGYDPIKKAYVDKDGCLIRDKFGQPF